MKLLIGCLVIALVLAAAAAAKWWTERQINPYDPEDDW